MTTVIGRWHRSELMMGLTLTASILALGGDADGEGRAKVENGQRNSTEKKGKAEERGICFESH